MALTSSGLITGVIASRLISTTAMLFWYIDSHDELLVLATITFGSQVCNVSWSNLDATVMCRELGFTTGISVQASNSTFLPGPADQVVLVADVTCSGAENRLSACSSRDAAATAGCSSHMRDAGVVCSNPPPPSPMPLSPPPMLLRPWNCE